MRLHKIRSKKHPGAVFLKVDHGPEGQQDDFVLKIYPEYEHVAGAIAAMVRQVIEAKEEENKRC